MSQMSEVSVVVSEHLNRQLVIMSQELVTRCIAICAERYHFDAEEANRMLGVESLKLERKAAAKKVGVSVAVAKTAFPLPYNGEFNDSCCYALRQNNGLYTQCAGVRKCDDSFCKSCVKSMQKIGSEVPEYGTIQQRMAADIFEYVDPKGRKPVSYTKVMNKYKITQEQVLEEANKINIRINSKHFVVPEDTKRGRPKKEKETETKVKGAKGRPKKDKKVIQIEGDEEDLFATLVAAAAQDAVAQDAVAQDADAEEEKAAAEAKKAEEKAAKKAAAEQEKAAKKAAAEQEKAAKKAAIEEEKAAKKAAIEEEKAAKKAAAEAKKASKTKPEKKAEEKAEAEEEEEPDVVKKIEFEGKKYLKSKKSGIVYDYNKYVKEGDQVIVGKWNDATNKIQFQEEELEEEEEEDEEEEELDQLDELEEEE